MEKEEWLVGAHVRNAVRVPLCVLAILAAMLGKKAAVQRSLGSLQVDISKSRSILDWQPIVSLEEGLKRCFESEK